MSRMNVKTLLLFAFLLVVSTIQFGFGQADDSRYRTIDGSQNNLSNPDWGAANTRLLRIAPVGYADGISELGGTDRPNPRIISNAVFDQPDLIMDPLQLSDFCWSFGQFIDHDFGFTPDGSELAFINVPTGDPDFDPQAQGKAVIPLLRNVFDPNTGRSTRNPREHLNIITAYLDGSAVYGSDEERAHWLRSFVDGKLKVSKGDLLPLNTEDGEFGSPLSEEAPEMDDATRLTEYHFVAGDARANENPLLLVMHTIFVREHNRQCERLKKIHPDWDDEALYQHARKIVGGLIQSITYDEWLPAVGADLKPYEGYDPSVNPQLSNTFTAAAFRLGHTLLSGDILRMDEEGNPIEEGHIGLRDAFFNVHAILDIGALEPYFNGMAEQTQQQFDANIVDDVRNFLFGPPGVGGLDLASINIQRGRERGLPGYNDVRAAFGLPTYGTFPEINRDRKISQVLQNLYGRVDRVDPWVGMLAEAPAEGSLLGPTLLTIITDQFTRLRDGDRFYYLNDPELSTEEKAWISNARFRDIIMYNTGIRLMQDNVFLSMPRSSVCNSMNLTIFGQVRTGSGRAVSDVSVNFEMDGESMIATSDETGSFDFGTQPACGMQKLLPTKEDELMNGITTLDIVLIARHILGMEALDSPYKMLAADVNEDGQITIQDLINIQALILGRDNVLDGKASWRFIVGGYEFNSDNPLTEDYPSTINFDTASPADFTSGFIAVKFGDVNDSFEAGPKNLPTEVKPRREGLVLSVPNKFIPAGETTTLQLYAEALEPLSGFQFSLSGDGVDFGKISSFALPYTAVDAEGRLLVSYAPTEAWSGKDVLLEVEIRAKRAGFLTELLAMENILSSEAYNQQLQFRSVTLLGERFTANTFQGGDAFPDPARSVVNIPFYQAEPGNVRLMVYDPTGRLLREWKEFRPAGSQYFTIQRSQLSNPRGNLVFRVEGAKGSFTGKMTWQ